MVLRSEGVDDTSMRGGLDGLLVLDESDGVESGVRWSLDAAHHALVKVAELLSAESGGAAADSGDFDVSAVFDGLTSFGILVPLVFSRFVRAIFVRARVEFVQSTIFW